MRTEQLVDPHARVIVEAVRARGALTRTELSSITQIPRSTLAQHLRALLHRGVLTEEDSPSSGRPGRVPRLVSMRRQGHVGVVLLRHGRTLLSGDAWVGIVSPSGEVEGVSVLADREALLSTCAGTLRKLAEERKLDLDQAVLSVPLPLRTAAQPVGASAVIEPLAELIGPEPHRVLQQLLGIRVLLANDTDLAALGEARWGSGRTRSPVAFLRVVTGLGVGLVAEGRTVSAGGVTGGEVAHIRIPASTASCLCGEVGCWINRAGDELGLPAMIGRYGATVTTMADVRDGVRDSSSPTALALATFAAELGRHLSAMFVSLQPSVLIIEEAARSLFDPLVQGIRHGLDDSSPRWRKPNDLDIVLSGLGRHAEAIGAAELVALRS